MEALRLAILSTTRSALYARMSQIENELKNVFQQCENLDEKDIPQHVKNNRQALMEELGRTYHASSNLWMMKLKD